MSTVVSSLSSLIQMITDSFRLSALFPAMFFIILNRLFILRYLEGMPPFKAIVSQNFWDEALVLSILTLLFGYTINALEVFIVQFYEGYTWQDNWLGRRRTEWYRRCLKELQDDIEELNCKLFDEEDEEERKVLDVKIKYYRSRLTNEYPPNAARVLPTKLGNVIAAFEAYPWERYRMDGVTFWTRILPILDRVGYLPYINQSRSTMDFLLNTSSLMALFGIECAWLRVFFVSDIHWTIPAAAFVTAWIFYRAAIISAYDWAAFFEAGFDLFRYHLATALGLKVAASFKDERRQWLNLTAFWNAQYQPESFQDFDHIAERWPVSPDKNVGG